MEAGPKQCYYDLLAVDIKATEEEIKRSFKKLSLKHHPDRNRQNPEEAKQKYQEITEAYNVLSDPKQREWYDKNREKLLVDKSDLTKEELQEQSYGFDIFAHLDESCFEGFDDSKHGFYTVYTKAFKTLDQEEEKAFKFIAQKGQKYENLPEFGTSKSDIKDVVKFYDTWKNFGTIKAFAWADSHDARDAENRYEKRQMEQENERERRKEKKKYVATVKDLVAFVKKMDPRREELLELERQEQEKILQQRENFKSDKQKKKEAQQRQLEEQRKKKAEEEHQRFLQQEEQRLKLLAEKQQQQASSQEFLCKVCNKTFESSQKLGNHRKSQQHKEEEAKQNGGKALDKAQQDKADAESMKQLLAVDPEKLTKKQAKELKRLQAQVKAKETTKQQEQKKKEKEQKKQQEEQNKQENDDDDEEEEEQGQNQGEKKKRKRNKKKKNQATEQQNNGQQQQNEQKVYEDYVPQANDEKDQQNEDDGWNDVTASEKTLKKVQKEIKKNQNNQAVAAGQRQNINGNTYESIEEINLRKFERQQDKKNKK